MTPEEARDRYRAINDQLLRHRFWTAALRTPYGGPWVEGVVNRLIALAGDEPVDYVESVGDVEMPDSEKGATATAVAFTATRRLHVRGVYRPRPEDCETEVWAKSRHGLLRLDVLELLEWGSSASWPPGLKLRLTYADGDELVLGEHGRSGDDEGAPDRLSDFYASLLADLTPARP